MSDAVAVTIEKAWGKLERWARQPGPGHQGRCTLEPGTGKPLELRRYYRRPGLDGSYAVLAEERFMAGDQGSLH